MKRRTLLLGGAALGAGAGLALLFRSPAAAPHVTLRTLSGESVPLASLRGQVVMVNFWQTTCGSCKKEMPNLVAAQQRYGARGYRTVSIALSRDHRGQVEAWARKHAWPFVVAMDDGAAAEAFGKVHLTPTSFLIDRQGRVLWKHVGRPRWAELDPLIEKALAV